MATAPSPGPRPDRPAPSYDQDREGYVGISSGMLDTVEGLRDARAFAEMIVDTVREGLLVLDLDLRVVAANESFYRSFGVVPEATLGRLVYDLGDGQWDLPELRDLLERILPHETTFDGYEVDHAFEGGGRRVLVLNARRLDDHQLILLAIEDATTLRAVEQEVRASAGQAGRQLETFGAALGAFEDFVYVLTPEARFTYANRALLDLWGIGLEDAVGKGFAELGYPDHLVALHRSQVEEVVRTGRAVRGDNAYTAPDGREGHYDYIFSPVFGEDGAVVSVAGITRDVTEARRTEAALRARERRQSFLVRLSDALRPLSDPEEAKDVASRLLGEHLGAARVGYAEDLGGGRVAMARTYAVGVPEINSVFRYDDYGPELLRAFRAGETVVRPDVHADPSLTADELAAHAALAIGASVNVPLVKGGRLVGVFAVHHAGPHAWADDEVALVEEVAERTWEAAERARAEHDLRDLNATLEDRVAAQTAEARARGERIRALSRALTMAEQAERRRLAHVLHDDLQQVLHGARIQAEVGNLDRLRALLDEASHTARSLSHELAPPILKGRTVGELFDWLAERKRERYGLEVEHAGGDVEVADEEARVLLYRLLRELLFNVSKHAGTDRARLRAEACERGVRVIVEDDGAGFDAAAIEADPRGGLGLASVRERLEAVGGRLAVASAPGEGTRVTIEVPAETR